jgi:hypothetical protein
MVNLFFILPAAGLVFSIIGITKKIKCSWLMLVMWTVSTLYLLSTVIVPTWWFNYILSELMLIIQIIWIVLANRQLQKEESK